MRTADGHDHLSALRGVRLGASAGPISLLLLPKCPLCLIPLFAAVGIVMPSSMGLLYLAGGILVLAWLSVVLFLSRQPLIRVSAVILAIMSGFAIAGQNRVLIWSAALAMTAVGIVVSRACTRNGGESEKCALLDRNTPAA